MKKQLITLLLTFIFCLTAVAPGFAANVNVCPAFATAIVLVALTCFTVVVLASVAVIVTPV